jgi:ABC-type multidrug transport system fused ATPase/permease subunit
VCPAIALGWLKLIINVIPVAHRLRTVVDYDRLIVLDKGEVCSHSIFPFVLLMSSAKIAEFDTPLNLINKENGIFRNMCLKSGTFGELEGEAKAKAERDLNRV